MENASRPCIETFGLSHKMRACTSMLAAATVIMLTACVQNPVVHKLDASVPASSAASIVGSRTSDGAYSFEYYAVDQVNHNDARGRFSSLGTAPDEFRVLLAPQVNNIWVEGRVRTGLGVPAKRVAAMLSFAASPGTSYQILGRAGNVSASMRIINLATKEVVAAIDNVAYTSPPPGYPTQFIPIFIGR
jgi:hypothetical protein